MTILHSVQLQNLDGLIQVRHVDEDVTIYWSTSSHHLLAVDADSLCIVSYGIRSESLEEAIQNANKM